MEDFRENHRLKIETYKLERKAMGESYKSLFEAQEAYQNKHPFRSWLYSGDEFRIPIFVYSIGVPILIVIIYFVVKILS